MELVPATRALVRVLPGRPLQEGERWRVFVHSPAGITELDSLYGRFHPFADGVLVLSVGIPRDIERIEVRTSQGLSGEFRFSEPPEPRCRIDIELR